MDPRLKDLIEAGKRRGFVLFDEIDELLPADSEGGPELDAVLAAIESCGVDIVEEPVSAVGNPGGETEYDSGDPLSVYLHEIGKLPPLTADREIELTKLVQGKGQEAEIAKMHLVESKLANVVHIARRHGDQGVHVLDLIQIGNIGLMKAVDKFDFRRGYKFSTYVTWWIRRSIIRAVQT